MAGGPRALEDLVKESRTVEITLRELKRAYDGRSVLVTGHTGFKGTWLCRILSLAGARVTGFALKPPTSPSLFNALGQGARMDSVEGDVQDLKAMEAVFARVQPQIVFHLAAQPIVRESYKDPVHTYGTNVMGTVNVLECVRRTASVESFLNVTTDKVYENREWEYGYRECDPLDGYDPYSNSKSCSELVTHSYQKSFFQNGRCQISTARAGNVIGGGDLAPDRIIPDCIRAALRKEAIVVRNPHSIRPYQHVLEPLCAYLTIAMAQFEEPGVSGCYNVGPDDCDCVTTGELTELFCRSWGEELRWVDRYDGGPHESSFLKLDCSRIKKTFGWRPRYHVEDAVERTVTWTKAYLEGEDMLTVTDGQILDYLG